MGLTYLPPMRMTEALAGRQIWTYADAGELMDFTGWTGTCKVADADAGVLVSPTLAVNAYGTITASWTAADATALADYAARRGLILPGVTAEIEITDGEDVLLFQAAVMLQRRAYSAANGGNT